MTLSQTSVKLSTRFSVLILPFEIIIYEWLKKGGFPLKESAFFVDYVFGSFFLLRKTIILY